MSADDSTTIYPADHKSLTIAPNNPFSTPRSSSSSPPPHRQENRQEIQQEQCSPSSSSSPYSAPSGQHGRSGSAASEQARPSSRKVSAADQQRRKRQESFSLFPRPSSASSSTRGMPNPPPFAHHRPRVNETLDHHNVVRDATPVYPRIHSRIPTSSTSSLSVCEGNEDAPPPSYTAATGGPDGGLPAGVIIEAGPWKPHPTVPLFALGEVEAVVDCPHCGARGMSRIKKHNSKYTCLAGLGLGVICCCFAVIPCLTHYMADTYHECSRCGQELARRKYRGDTEVFAATPRIMPVSCVAEAGTASGGYTSMGQMQRM